MARQSRGRIRLGRIFSPRSRSAAAVASAEAQEKRRKQRAKKWRERFKRFSLSAWHESAIVQTVCGLFRTSADTARAVRAATTTAMVGVGYRQLRIEGLEERQMLNATYHNLASGNFSQDWSNTAQITTNNDWNNVPSIIGYSNNLTNDAGADPSTRLTAQTTQNVTANHLDPNFNATGGIAEFQPIFFDDFDSYANQAAFEAAWPSIGTTTDATKKSAQLSTVQSVSATNSVFVPVSTTATTSSTEYRNRGSSFGETGTVSIGSQIVWSFDFYDSIGGNPQRNFSNLQDTTAPGSSNQLISMGLSNNQLSTASGGNFYMARILGYDIAAGSVDPDGGPNETGTLGTAPFFKLNDFAGSPLRSVGWHNLKVVISTNDGLSTDYEFYVDNVLAERVSNVATTVRSYDNITIGSGLTNGTATAYFDNERLEVIQSGGYNPVVGMQGSGTFDAPNLVLHMDATGQQNVTLNFNARDIDGNADDAIQKIGVQYRVGNSGNFTHLVTSADLTTINAATQVTPISVTLPGLVANASQLQIRILTNDAGGVDEWVGIDDITVTSTPIQPPVFTSADSHSIAENTTPIVGLTTTDPDVGQTSTFSITGGADAAHFSIAGNQLSFVTSRDFENPTDSDTNGVYLVDVTANDGNGGLTVQSLTVTVTDANDNPIFANQSFSVSENAVNGTVVGQVVATDGDDGSQNLSFAIQSGNGSPPGAFAISNSGLITVNDVAQLDREALASFALGIDVTDDGSPAQSASATVTISLLPVNDFSPNANGDSDSVTEDGTLVASGNVLTNDTDSDLPPEPLSVVASFTGTINGDYGTLSLAADGSYTYTLDNLNSDVQELGAFQILNDLFVYKATDGTNESLSTAILNITINGTNDSAVIGGVSTGTVSEDGTLVASDALTVSDVDTGQAAFVAQAAGVATYGTYTLDSSGNWVYTLDNSNAAVQSLTTGQSLNDSFTAATIDGTTQLVSITIDGLDEPPGVVILNGAPGANTLVIDLDAGTYTLDGNTFPLAGIGDMTFHAGADLGDSIVITGGTFGTVVYDYTGPTSGDIDLSDYGLMLHYTGLDPISNDGSAANAVFNLPASGDNASLVISSPGMLTLSSSPVTFESTTFALPSTSFTVNTNGGDDTLEVEPSNGYAVSVDGGAHTVGDTLIVDAAGTYAINTGSEIRVQGFANIAYTAFETVNLLNAALAPMILYVDDSWVGTAAGADPDGLGAAINFGVDAFATIQAAINAAVSGTIIYVHSGSYTEALTIDESLTISEIDGIGTVDVDAGLAFNGVDILPTTSSISVTIDGLDFSGASTNGIHVGKSGANLANLTLTNSSVSGGLTGVWVDGGTLDMTSTLISGVGVFGVQIGNLGDADITDSEITGTVTTAAGVIVSSGHADILDSILTNDNRGLLVNATGSASVHGSNLTGNSTAAIVNGTATTVDASGNWFGTNSEAGVQAMTTGPVDFTPYLNSGTDTDGGARGFGGDFSHLHVTALGGQTSGGRISEALGYLADGTLSGGSRIIDVHAGAYVDNVAVNKSVLLRGLDTTAGDGAGDVIVQTAADDADILYITANDVEVTDLTLEGVNGLNQAYGGIRTSDSSEVTGINIHDNFIRNVNNRGIKVGYNFSINPSTVTVADNTIENMTDPGDGFGIAAFHSSGTISGNSVTMALIGIFTNTSAGVLISGNDVHDSQYGIYLANSGGAVGPADEVDGNTIDTGATTTSVGIEVFNAGKNVSIHDNIISGVNTGMNVYSALAAPVGDLVTIEDNLISGFVGAASVGLFISSDDFGGNAGAVNLAATASGNTITGATTGIWVQGAAARTATVTIDGDNEITGSNVGILVEEVSGGNAVVTIDGNDNSIHGNVTGIDVTGGDATISGNHIYDNTTGIRLTTGGTATINSNNFEGGGSPDNGTDILLTATSGGINSGTMTGNTFAGDTFYIDNQSTQDIDATTNTFDEASNFRIEDKIHHEMDTDLSIGNGLVTWVSGNLYVTDAGTDHSIQRGVDVATAGDTVNVEAGLYVENVSINKSVTLKSNAGRASTTIQGVSGVGALGTLLIANNTNNVKIGDLTGNGFTIVGIDNGNPGIENSAIYLQGNHSGIEIRYNDVVANGDAGLMAEFGQSNSNFTIDNNIFSGQTFVGPTPADNGFGNQFTTPNVPRQLVVMGSGSGTTTTSNITFTNNLISGTAGGSNGGGEQGNSLVTIDALGTNISGNTFSGTTTRFGNSLRARGANNSITGNLFTSTGLGANTVDLYVNRAGNVIQGNTFSSSAGGAIQVDGALGVATIGGAGLGQGNSISAYTIGVTLSGGSAIVDSNTFSSSAVADLEVNGGTARVQGNTFGGTIGVRIQSGGIADLGTGGGPDYTGLGASTGGNDFSSYTTTATATSGAIVNLNTNGTNANPGRQGAPPDVQAFGNIWAVNTPNGIENVVWHDGDVTTLGFVDFAAFGNLLVSVDDNNVNEGDTVNVNGSFTNVPQAHTVTISWGDGSADTVINLTSGVFTFNASHIYADDADGSLDNATVYPITVTVDDPTAAPPLSDTSLAVTVNNVAPSVTLVGPATAGTGQTFNFTFTNVDPGEDAGDVFTQMISATTPLGSGATGVVSNIVFTPSTGSGTFDVTFTAPAGGGTVLVSVTVTDDDGTSDSDSILVNVGNTLQVTNFVTNPSGFDVTFNRAPNVADLNLYDGRLGSELVVVIDPTDIIVTRSVGIGPATVVNGSMAWNGLTNTLSWVKSGSVLSDDFVNYTYNVTLESGATAFHDAFGNLDGNGDFDDTPGEDYTNSFVVNATTARVVGVRDIGRGPGQDVDESPVLGNGWAVTLDDATNVRSLNFDFRYDPTQLAINGASLAPGLAGMGWTITVNNLTPGQLIVTSSSPANELSGTDVPVIIIDATVKTTAPYGDAEILRFENVAVGVENGMLVDPAPHIEDRAIHKINYLGDADGNHLYDGFDVALMSRVAVAFDPGFGNNDWTDPLVIGDINSDGVINSIDTAIVGQKVVFPASTPQIPNIVVLSPVVAGSGVDPTLSIGDEIPAGIGGPVAIPVNITIDPSVNLSSATYTVQYDPAKLTYVSTAAASVFSGWSVIAGDSTPVGTITVLMSDAIGYPTGAVAETHQLATITFNVLETFTGGTSALSIAPVNQNEGGLFWTNDNVDDGSVKFALLGDYNQNGVVDTADRTVWRNTLGNSVTPYSGADGSGNGIIDNADFNIWRSHYGLAASPGPGAGAEAFSMSLAGPEKSYSAPVSEPLASVAVTTDAAPPAARDEVLEGFALSPDFSGTRSQNSRSAALVSHEARWESRTSDANLVDAVIDGKRKYISGEDDSLANESDADNADAVDELFADFDCELLKV